MKISYLLSTITAISYVLASPQEAPITSDLHKLEKRYQKVRVAKSTTTTTSEETPKPWIRTIYSSVVEIVTPTVIQSVTFSAKPPLETDYPQPWVSLNKQGQPKTIIPEIKNGLTKKPSPSYSTYFQTPTTVTYSYEDLKAHNMDPSAYHEEVEFIDEDKTYVSLNPIIRCTPDRYFMKNLARDVSSAPFCTPHENVELRMGEIYFITWYTKFFDDEVKKVKLHFSYIKEDLKRKGMKKREVESAFFTTEWIDNINGLYPLDIQEDWLLDEFYQSVSVSIQPDNVSDDDFNLLQDSTVFKILRRSKVGKKTKEEKALEDEGITDDSAYYVVMSIPTVVAFSALGMYFFLWLTRKDRDVSSIRAKVWKSQHKILGKFKPKGNNRKYSELPQFDNKGKKQ
ncbi:hypothetical protein WICMUC_002719 [Wickerhamomyces mucosus]|uniref:Uncharacterized protein n=1 Tax=Wickerhamomyces mucosus TaxID=1378264 RepID=A0A9P8PPQ5_9ASCO|nr:hypothetical protein WICMUC_002719 [Wickerhamomyces mucosus]